MQPVWKMTTGPGGSSRCSSSRKSVCACLEDFCLHKTPEARARKAVKPRGGGGGMKWVPAYLVTIVLAGRCAGTEYRRRYLGQQSLSPFSSVKVFWPYHCAEFLASVSPFPFLSCAANFDIRASQPRTRLCSRYLPIRTGRSMTCAKRGNLEFAILVPVRPVFNLRISYLPTYIGMCACMYVCTQRRGVLPPLARPQSMVDGLPARTTVRSLADGSK